MTREESIAFYKEHSKRLYNISLRIVQDSALAEEIMQDTILKALRPAQGPQGLGTKAQENAWLTKTCIRASIDELRKRKRERLFLDEYASEEAPNYFTPESIDIPKDELNHLCILPILPCLQKQVKRPSKPSKSKSLHYENCFHLYEIVRL